MREGLANSDDGDQALDAFSDTDSEKSLLSDSDLVEPARERQSENSRNRLPHGPGPLTSSPESDGRVLLETRMPSSSDDALQVSWRHLPRKDQLIVITLARLSEPLVQTSLQVARWSTSCISPGSVLTTTVVHVLHVEMVRPGPLGLGHCWPGRYLAVRCHYL